MELVRIARRLDGRLEVSRTAAGRGAWLCRGQRRCFDLAERRRAFGRAFRQVVDALDVADLREHLFGNDPQNLRDLSASGQWPGGGTRPTKG